MSLEINENKTNIENIMKLVGGEGGTGGVISTLDSIKADIKTSTASSKGKLDSFTITSSNDPVVLAFKDAVSSSGEIYTPYTNIDKSLDSGSYVVLIDLLKSFYSCLGTLKTKIEEKEAAEENNNRINNLIGTSRKNYTKLNEYNAENNTDYSYKDVVDLTSYKTNCSSYLAAIQGVKFGFSEEDSKAVDVTLTNPSSNMRDYNFGYGGYYSEDAYVLSGPYTVDGEERKAEYNRDEYQAAVDEHKDIILTDGDELVFDEGFLGIGRESYNSNSCVTMYSYNAETGMYHRVSYVDQNGTKHYDSSGARTVEQMRNATFNDTWEN